VTSNLFGAVSLINMLGVWGVLAAIILILTFRGVLKALKKYSSSFFTVALGIALIVVVEFIYGALHTVFFKDILEGKQHLPFDMTYMDAAFYLAIIISGASIAVAVMTSLQTADDAEQQRIDEIDSRLQNQ
jgi:sterol desaturase/sphingolipid hydroxylase (fatty acid hydroxylase superfamily)